MNERKRNEELRLKAEEELEKLQRKKKIVEEQLEEIENQINEVLSKIPIEALKLQHNVEITLKEKVEPFKTVLCLKKHYEQYGTFSNIRGIGNYKNKLIKAAIHKYL